MTSEAVTNDDRERLRQTFLIPVEDHSNQWQSLWVDQFVPWDKGVAGSSLIDLIAAPEHQDLFTNNSGKKVLVPGCGRGYDVVLFAQKGYDAYGVDVATTAVSAAKKYAEEQKEEKATFLVGDFFKDTWCTEAGIEPGKWDLIYDYTFLCALPPTLRLKWAARMAELLSQGGLLICLEFPLYKDPATGGPPWGLTSEIYVELLEKVGLERIVHDKPTRFHAISKGTDMITVWKKK